MANTTLFTALNQRLLELRNNLLPVEFDPLSNYDSKTIDMTKGYTLLVHSEIEYFIESLCCIFVKLQVERYKNDKTPSPCALALVAYSKLEWTITTDEMEIPKITSSKLTDTLTTLLSKMSISYNKDIVNSNNGIKTKNLLKLIAPTGMIEHFPEVEMESFNTFGGHRGNLAHVSTKHINFDIDPLSQLNHLTNNMLPVLQAFDEKLLLLEPNLATINWEEVKPGQL
ncbi:hypothetical protein IL332_07940 [Aeromonas caviae]|uniref:HEPN domain-containing protein n=1 Tax=Aeromonas caviae TaxID=648 RepID=UPI000ACCDFA0|nr:HEPN domain-containing protein [Aeromonas caviae]MDX7855403.1 HEPN domain-containing protein [Aeromonas caviae]QOK20700.1 hypothetical protein IL332_07940 [Aeromonas caviae]